MSRRQSRKNFEKSVRGQYVRRQERLWALGFTSYSDFLRSSLWQATKRKAHKAGMIACLVCRSREGVQLHHNKYEIHANPRLDHLVPLCDWCHTKVHEIAHEKGYNGTMRAALRKHRRNFEQSGALAAFLTDEHTPSSGEEDSHEQISARRQAMEVVRDFHFGSASRVGRYSKDHRERMHLLRLRGQ